MPRCKTPTVARLQLEEARTRRDAEVTERLNALYRSSEFAREQARVAQEWDAVGTDWSGEPW